MLLLSILLDFSTSLENRVQLLKGLRLSSLEEAKRIVTFMKGAKKLFKTLKIINYNKSLTMETVREKVPHVTAKKNLIMIKKF